MFFRGLATSNDASLSVVLRGANDMMLGEMERSFHDALCVEQRVMESKSLVVGGGAVETALYTHLSDFALSLSTHEQLAVEAFGKALGTGVSGFRLAEAQLLREPSGRPYLSLSGGALRLAEERGLSFSVSVTHTKQYAAVVVAAEPKG